MFCKSWLLLQLGLGSLLFLTGVYPFKDFLAQSSDQVISLSPLEEARHISVRILFKSGTGSGVIVKRQGYIYQVLTNYHVVSDNPPEGYQILTPDGQVYQAKKLSNFPYKGLDIALLEFQSYQNYQVATIINQTYTPPIGETVYAAGFPAWRFHQEGDVIVSVEATQNWGFKAFEVTTGTLEMFSEPSLSEGYQIGYTNRVTVGMSGGALLNRKGQLIGINGKLKHPLQGIQAFIFSDGSIPSEQQFQKMDSLSWAIPVTQFKELIQ